MELILKKRKSPIWGITNLILIMKSYNSVVKIDGIDKKILKALMNDARTLYLKLPDKLASLVHYSPKVEKT